MPKPFDKEFMRELINRDLRTSGLRPINDILFIYADNPHGDPAWTTCLVIGYAYAGPNNTTKINIYGAGPAHRRATDPIDPDIGRRWALTRAVRSFVDRQRELGVKLEPRKRRKKLSRLEDRQQAIVAANETAAALSHEELEVLADEYAAILTHLPSGAPEELQTGDSMSSTV